MKRSEKYKCMTVLGTMSGTSMDGIDISVVETDGKTIKRKKINCFFRYSKKTTKYLNLALKNQDLVLKNKKFKKLLDNLITIDHINSINKTTNKFKLKIDLIGFHGQTIYHSFKNKVSIQLGSPNILAKKLNKCVISNFRDQDLLNGGQGAPLAPIYHKLLIEEFCLKLPSCIINIGGVSNLTFWDGIELLGFDTGPGNGFMDYYTQLILNELFDRDGKIASFGKPNTDLLDEFLGDEYFALPPPKSLDRKHFQKYFEKLIDKKLNKFDALATLAHMTVDSIIKSFNFFPKFPKSFLIVGGGAKNINLINLLKKSIKVDFIKLDEKDISIDFIESELIAFLSGRILNKLPTTFPSTTGVIKSTIGGEIYKPF